MVRTGRLPRLGGENEFICTMFFVTLVVRMRKEDLEERDTVASCARVAGFTAVRNDGHESSEEVVSNFWRE